jgi:hypothetical protein
MNTNVFRCVLHISGLVFTTVVCCAVIFPSDPPFRKLSLNVVHMFGSSQPSDGHSRKQSAEISEKTVTIFRYYNDILWDD